MTPLDWANYKTPMVPCPACGHEADYGTVIAGDGTTRPVKPGDISMCISCKAFLVYVEGLSLRLLSDAEWLAMPKRQRMYLTKVREYAAEIQNKHK